MNQSGEVCDSWGFMENQTVNASGVTVYVTSLRYVERAGQVFVVVPQEPVG